MSVNRQGEMLTREVAQNAKHWDVLRGCEMHHRLEIFTAFWFFALASCAVAGVISVVF